MRQRNRRIADSCLRTPGLKPASTSGPRYSRSYYYDTWTSSDYAHLTFADAVLRSMPSHVHDRHAYVQQMSQQTGISPHAVVGDLSNDQLTAISTAFAAESSAESAAGGAYEDNSGPGSFGSSGGGDFGSTDTTTPTGSFGSAGSDFGSDDTSTGGSFGSGTSDFGSSSPSDNS